METNNSNQQPQSNPSLLQIKSLLNPTPSQKGNFLIPIGLAFLILIVGVVAYYLGTTKNSRPIITSKAPQQISSPSPASSNLGSPEQILQSLEKRFR